MVPETFYMFDFFFNHVAHSILYNCGSKYDKCLKYVIPKILEFSALRASYCLIFISAYCIENQIQHGTECAHICHLNTSLSFIDKLVNISFYNLYIDIWNTCTCFRSIRHTYEGPSKSSVMNGSPCARRKYASLISCIHICHSIIHPRVKCQRNRANISIVIGIQSSISHLVGWLFWGLTSI